LSIERAPYTRLLSNGRYTTLITASGSGCSTCSGYALTGWAGDRTEDGDGVFLYVRDLDDGMFWSVGHQPTREPEEAYRTRYQPGRFRIERLRAGIDTCMNVCVAPDDDVEIRRLTLHNVSDHPRRIELTSYTEVVLNYAAAHAAHPAFSKLFVQTEHVRDAGVLLARRRPRSEQEQHPWMMHALIGPGALHVETDRARFLGRGRTLARPLALTSSAPLSGTNGNVLDPVFSLRRVLRLEVDERVDVTLLLATAPTRTAALDLAARYHIPVSVEQAFDRAAEHERAQIQRYGFSEERAEYLQELVGAMLYGHPALRHAVERPLRGGGQLTGLGAYGFSYGALHAVVHVEDAGALMLVHDLLQAQAYWETKAIRVDLLVLCAEPSSLKEEVSRRLETGEWAGFASAGRAVVVRSRTEVRADHLNAILAAAHLVIATRLPPLDDIHPQRAASVREPNPRAAQVPAPIAADISPPFSNGRGDFTPDGTEYVMRIEPDARPPMPWVNVIANETFGFLVSESGAGYTWGRNSRQNRLTPWYNDPIADPYGAAFYIRDDDTHAFWSPLPGPVPPSTAFEVRHGFGYTQWRHTRQDFEHDVVQFVPRHDPVKITRLRLNNTGSKARQLSIFAYHRLVLGVLPSESGRFVVTEWDADAGAILAQNHFNDEFSDGVVFAAVASPAATAPPRFTGDRAAFLGRGSPAAPAAVRDAAGLDGTTGAGLDPCAAVQVTVRVAAHSTIECIILLGEVTAKDRVRTLTDHYQHPEACAAALQEVRAFWKDTVSAVQIETPAPAIDVMVNGWLLYQTLSCRLWGRSAFYQSGGAFGFRDQLQDAAALILTRPDLTRAQILLHAAHQFVEGDVSHWWHPPAGRGIRTRFSDDLLWLPYITACYARTTGDWSILTEAVGFLTARPLVPGEDEAYLTPEPSPEVADLYTHCCRALDRSLTRGDHGLPLMGTGDWNDGMNRVGREGRGESVWVGFFLYTILGTFIPICERRADADRARRYRDYQTQLKAALNDNGWDGQWYRRAYYDDGTALGSAQNQECRIDALVQAWAVLSGAAPAERAEQAMATVEHELISTDVGVIRLLSPPFDHDPHDPGYIKGYVPGIRENGGQYTHAALWVVQALAALGRRDRAAKYLEMLGPVSRSRTPRQVSVYQIEPYVVAADIYGTSPHIGRGGWSWYTGSAGWMYRIAVESILGLGFEGGATLRVKPCIPDEWPGFTVRYRHPDRSTRYEIAVRNPTGPAEAVESVLVDGQAGSVEDGGAMIPLCPDGLIHRVDITLGRLNRESVDAVAAQMRKLAHSEHKEKKE